MNLYRSRGKTEARGRVISAGYEIVSNRGFNNLSREKISLISKISEEDISEFFPTDDNLKQVLQSELDATIIRFADYELGKLPEDASTLDKLKATGRAYFSFSQEAPDIFGAFISAPMNIDLPEGFEGNFNDLLMPPTVTRVLGYIRDLIEELDGPKDSKFLLEIALTAYATIHGITHLCTFGICRLFSPVAKKQLLQGSLESLTAGIVRSIKNKGATELNPKQLGGNVPFNAVPKAPEFPRNNDDEKQIAMYRGLIDLVWDLGQSNVDLSRVAQYANLPKNDVLRLADGADKLVKEVEDYLDNQDQGFIGAQCFSLPGGSNAFSYLKAAGFGYVSFALHDPIGWNVLIEIASGAIVPTDFDNFDQSERMGVAFSFLVELTKKAIENSNNPRQAWILYSQVFSAWASAHGLAHLFSTGSLKNLDEKDKLEYLGPVFDIVIQGLLSTLNIDSVDDLKE
ncbi:MULTISPECIES: TetR/AcrR family transcriptional regulator [Corynebacterium]|uniref:WHG domain-containing protein n=1 Tax=Corynebacterium glucuronolyticum TaxID=39791 RepID=A0A7T4EEG2_9CORY|nr:MULTISPECIES: WHG domain-containing protein [Corynebacterium]OFO47452.1 hypothetical protein HMPREF3044_01130 [Corynebacterium sp. HMSC073D01]QQB45875.1 WHG domain-containing protein [Corynebacterium glucuronolyticum]QQU87496.1 WHG domain-containing protein [Corynebacterium glucuronolyticum]WKD63412.1 hypothetical protein CGLUCO_05770 [Corynebacterium glucuronolyticum DSM 44120]SMB78609.1 DNA-binding transcriptional regulator, AcrR family [Corynebacterium glucuronolyticum]